MSTNSRPGGARPPKTPAPQRPPATRQERRDAARREQRLASARTVAVKKPAWQSPMSLITAGAVVVGLVVIVLASGVLNPKPLVTAGNLLKPISATPASLIDPANPRALGQPNAPVKVEIWSDFQCPACDQFATTVEPDLVNKYAATGKAYVVYRDRVIIDRAPTDTESHQSAAAARCAGDKFWAFHDYLFENQNKTGENKGTFSPAFLGSVADAVGADKPKYDACMANGAAGTVALVNAESAQGAAAGVNGTPTIALNGTLLQAGPLPMSTLGPAIDALIAAASPAPSASPAASGASPASASPAASTAP
jgi:protein-disulfide isomerase